MGQAKHRKETEPTFGRVPKKELEKRRGVLLSPPLRIDGNSIQVSGGLDANELRYALLFWDDLAVSTNRMIQVDPGPEAQHLMTLGLLREVPVHLDYLGPGMYQEMHLPAFRHLEGKEPGKWSMSTGVRSFQWLGMPEGQADHTDIELIRAIPVPDEGAALEDILEFKSRRAPELMRLMAEIDRIGITVRTAESPHSELQKQVAFVQESCVDILRTGKEWKLPLKISDVKCSFEFSLPKSLTTYAISDLAIGMPLIGTAIGSLASCLKITGEFKRQVVRDRSSPYQYVHEIHERLF